MVKTLISAIKDRKRDIHDRLFMLLAAIALIALYLAVIIGIFLGENVADLILLLSGGTFSLLLFAVLFKFDKVRIAANIIGSLLVFAIMPLTFFTSGGINGGTPLWFIFSTIFVSMVISGKYKWFCIISNLVIEIACYIIAFNFPNAVIAHDDRFAYEDSLMSLIIVSLVCVFMVTVSIKFFSDESEREESQRREIEELSDAQRRFFSSMSHEIRTPINTIIGLNEMILREDVSEEVASDAIHIQGASKMLLSLINDILDMSKIQSGEMSLTIDDYYTGDMLSDIVAMHWMRAREKGLDFKVDLAPDLPSQLRGDEMRIKQVVINLLNNAIKYTRDGSISLSVQCEDEEDGTIKMIYTVSDTGMGIKRESIPYLFSAFKRVDEKKNRYIEGTGLGLNIVKQLVDLMDGKVTVNSVYTKGSTFIVEIPQKVVNRDNIGEIDMMRRHEAKSRGVYEPTFTAPSARVLVVDDNASNILVVEKLLRETKVQVDTAMSGPEALGKTLENEYHVIFMDHLMPDMDGIECTNKIRNQIGGLCKESKFIILTANAGAENRRLYEKAGFDSYLLKPTTGEAIEREMIHLLPSEIVTRKTSDTEIVEESRSWVRRRAPKANIIITTESVADLTEDQIKNLNIGILPHEVITGDGKFRDGLDIDASGLLQYMEDPNAKVDTSVPGVEEHENFFADMLTKANNIVHVVISKKNAKTGYYSAKEAAKAFDNVFVVDSSHLSSGQGLVALAAVRLMQDGLEPDEIVKKLNVLKKRVHTSFVVDSMDYLARRGQIPYRVARISKAFAIRPVIKMKKGVLGVGNIMFGSTEYTRKKYIKAQLRHADRIDKRVLFVTYVGLSSRELESIREEIEKRVRFERIIFQKASPAIAVNSGPGTFGLLYIEKS